MRKQHLKKRLTIAHQALGTAANALAYARILDNQHSDARMTIGNIRSSINSFQFWCQTIIGQIIKQ